MRRTRSFRLCCLGFLCLVAGTAWAQDGWIRVTIEPPRAVYEGATWQVIEDFTIYESGEVAGPFPTSGSPYEVFGSFVESIWCSEPFSQVALTAGQTSDVVLVYEPGDMLWIDSASYSMGDYRGQGGHAVTLDDFSIDYYEVTVFDYQQFSDATGTPMPQPPPWGWQGDQPMVNVTWNEAAAYAAWTGKRLPTEAEYEYVMRGGPGGGPYPTGNTIDTGQANYLFSDEGMPMNVGSFAFTGAGVYDIAGNAWEWCRDWYTPLLSGPVSNPQGPASGTAKCLRGGSWASLPSRLRCDARFHAAPAQRYADVGFRCARDGHPCSEQEPFPIEPAAEVPDWWSMLHLGLELGSPDAFEGSRDTDGDGLTDAEEFVTRTDPGEAASVLAAVGMRPVADGGVEVTWSSRDGVVYSLERGPGPAGPFATVAENLGATPPLNRHVDRPPSTAAAWFYRVGAQ